MRKAKNMLLDIEPKTVRKEIRNNNLLWTRYSVESNSSDESQGLDRHQAKMSELNENGLNPQSKSYIDKDNANKTNLQEVKRGLEAGEIEDAEKIKETSMLGLTRVSTESVPQLSQNINKDSINIGDTELLNVKNGENVANDSLKRSTDDAEVKRLATETAMEALRRAGIEVEMHTQEEGRAKATEARGNAEMMGSRIALKQL